MNFLIPVHIIIYNMYLDVCLKLTYYSIFFFSRALFNHQYNQKQNPTMMMNIDAQKKKFIMVSFSC